MRGKIASCFAPHPNPLPMNLPLSLITDVKLIVGKFMAERGLFGQGRVRRCIATADSLH